MVLEVVGVVLDGGCGFPRWDSPRAAEVVLVEWLGALVVVLLVDMELVGGWDEERVFFLGLLDVT